MKSVLLLHTSSDLYGAGRIFLNTILMLRARGYNTIVALTGDGPLVDELRTNGISVEKIKLGILRRKYMNPLGLVNRIWYTIGAIWKLRSLIRREQVDIVFSNACGIYAGSLAAKMTGTKHVFHVHEIIEQPKWFASVTGAFMKRFSDRVIVVSEAVRQAWQPPMPGYQIDLVYNGLDYTRFINGALNLRAELGIGADVVIIGMIGRVHFWKGQSYFLEIASELKRMCGNVKFLMVGDAYPGYEYLYDEIKDRKQSLGLEEDVIDLGFRSDTPRVFQTLDIFVLPSILPDPLPTVILEAMASAKPVVATSHGGALEMVVDGETGFHMPINDPKPAAELVGRLVKDRELRAQMGNAGRKRVLSSFSKEKYEEKMMRILQNL